MIEFEAVIIPFLINEGLAVLLLVLLLNDMRFMRKMKQTDIDSPRTLTDGEFVGIRGRVSAEGDALESPITQKRVVYYRSEVVRGSGDSEQTMFKEEKSIPFSLGDGYGRVQIELTKPFYLVHQLIPKDRRVWMYEEFGPTLQEKIPYPGDRKWKRTFRCKEIGLEVGSQVTVFGTVVEGKLKGSAGKRLVIHPGEVEDLFTVYKKKNRIVAGLFLFMQIASIFTFFAVFS